MTRAAGHRRAVCGAILAAVLLVSGCSWVDPPEELTDEADTYAETLRMIEGVDDVQVDVRALDPIDEPDEWVTHALVDATTADQLAVLPGLLAAVEGPASSRLDLVVRFPATGEVAGVVISVKPGLEAAAAALRVIPAIENVNLDGFVDTVTLDPGVDLAPSVQLIRDAQPWSSITSLRVHHHGPGGSVQITATTPSTGILGFLESVGVDASVDHLSLSLSEDFTRGTLIIDTTEPLRLAELLRASDSVGAGDPAIRFLVHSDDDEIRGCVGGGSC